MSAKLKTIQLAYPIFNRDPNFKPTGPNDPDIDTYEVVKVTDSVEYLPGRSLTKKQVEAICDDPNWKVTITKI